MEIGGTLMAIFPTLEAMTIAIKTVFTKQTTEVLPWKGQRTRSPRYRSTFALLHDEQGEELCIGCKMCEKICPSEIIKLIPTGRIESPITGKKRGYCSDFTLDLNACIFCELCVQVCPEDAIRMLRTRETPGFSREDLVLTMPRLYDNESLGLLSWGSGSNFMEAQDPKRGLEEPEPAPELSEKT